MRTVLVAARNAKGWTQGQAAKAICISRSFYVQLETGGRNPSIDVALRVAKVMGVQIETVFGVATGDAMLATTASQQ